MPKDPKRNLQRYQVQGGHLNEFEFQKSQGKLAEESDLPFADQTGQAGLSQMDHVAAVTADARQKVQRRKRKGTAKAGGVRKVASGKKSAKKGTRKSASKTPAKSGTKKLMKGASRKKSAKKVAKSSKKTTKQKSTTKRK
ncbi:MAG TPA: hypothetical protein VEW46_10775 [Pyrinomonadaceae bacterium]|nr:hypothetical protein [Pyrinomonadaceae bacterium]